MRKKKNHGERKFLYGQGEYSGVIMGVALVTVLYISLFIFYIEWVLRLIFEFRIPGDIIIITPKIHLLESHSIMRTIVVSLLLMVGCPWRLRVRVAVARKLDWEFRALALAVCEVVRMCFRQLVE